MTPGAAYSFTQIAKLAVTALDALEAGRPLPPAAASWLRTGLCAITEGRDLRAALGLKGRQGKRAEAGVKLARRNKALGNLVARLEGEAGGTCKAAEMAAHVMAGRLPPPPGLADDLAALEATPPISWRHILRIVSEAE